MYFILRKFVEIYMRGKFKIHVHNKEKIPAPKIARKGGFIVACNHQFYYDPPAVAAMIKGRFSFMAKAELFEKKAFAGLIRICGAFPVTRGEDGEKAMQRALSDIKKGRIFVIFPEGTRSKDGTIGRGKSGVSLIAAMSNAPVLPVCVMYKLDGDKKRLDFAVGDMIPAQELNVSLENRDRRELKRITERIMNAIKELQLQILDSIK